jgi:hypothetical protein
MESQGGQWVLSLMFMTGGFVATTKYILKKLSEDQTKLDAKIENKVNELNSKHDANILRVYDKIDSMDREKTAEQKSSKEAMLEAIKTLDKEIRDIRDKVHDRPTSDSIKKEFLQKEVHQADINMLVQRMDRVDSDVKDVKRLIEEMPQKILELMARAQK